MLMASINKAVTEIGADRLQETFSKYSFVYGTTSGGSVVGKAANFLLAPPKENRVALVNRAFRTKAAKTKKIYDPGARASNYLKGENSQMMDCYYGQEGTEVHLLRDPVIGEFIHKAMGFKGDYNQNTSGREAYLATYPGPEGWLKPENGKRIYGGYYYDDPEDLEFGLTATKAMSTIVRYGASHFAGTLILEGANIAWRDVFIAKKKSEVANSFFNGAISDTGREGISLMKYFVAKRPFGSNVAFGNGRLIFNWNGKEIEPSKDLIRANWLFGPNAYTPSFEDCTTREEFKFFKDFTAQSKEDLSGR